MGGVKLEGGESLSFFRFIGLKVSLGTARGIEAGMVLTLTRRDLKMISNFCYL